LAAINAGMRVVGIGESHNLFKADLVVAGLNQINLNTLKSFFNQQ
jgi:beta-phosphoglucomutase-like phosphatase (HAD superfamily)